jgi:hypothetical protein
VSGFGSFRHTPTHRLHKIFHMQASTPLDAEPPAAAKSDLLDSRLEVALLLMICLITWSLSHGYLGIFHDAGLYTLQALARLDPASIGQDVFLRFGSQDRFTLFTPFYSAAAASWGAEPAAAWLTFAFQMALFAGAWALARALMPKRWALYALAVLIAIPGDYGTDRIFTLVEPFLTPRMAAEALVLASLAAAFRSRRLLSLALIGVATLIHPIMAAAGIVALLIIYVAIPRPRLAIQAFAILVVLWAVAVAVFPSGITGRFDDVWFRLVMDRSPYLFISNWRLDDWARVAVTIATLIAGLCASLGERPRTLCLTALLTLVTGLVLTFVACDELHLILFTQLQPWRWQWLGVATAALLLPMILRACWLTAAGGRTTSLFLVAAWVFGANGFALVAALAAVGSIAGCPRLAKNEARWVFCGACGMLAIALTWRFASNLQFTESYYFDPRIPMWLRRTMSFVRDGTVPVACISLVGWMARQPRARPGSMLAAALAAAAIVALLPQTWMTWSLREFSPQRIALFAPLRDSIPAGANVFWPDSPVAAWLLVQRPSYLSVLQTSGLVFSRATAVEMQRRSLALASVIPPESFLSWTAGFGPPLSLDQQQRVCRLGAFEFLVTSADLGIEPVAFIPGKALAAARDLRLYRCPFMPAQSDL